MINQAQIEDLGCKFMSATAANSDELETLAQTLSREEELAVLDWIDEQEMIRDMVRGTADPKAFDASGRYVPASMRV